jgi:hypothetical protein
VRWFTPNRVLLWAGLLILSIQALNAQSIVWEKQWGYAPGTEEIGKICPADGGHFFATGFSTKFRKDTLGSTYYYTLLIKFDENGDTLWMKRLNILYRYTSFLGRKFGNVYQMVLLTQSTWFYKIPVLVEFTENGIILETKYYTQLNNYLLGDGVRLSDGGLLFPGTGVGPGTNQSAFKFNFLNELEWAYAYFPPVEVNAAASRVEPMANGHYLLSGRMGKRIYGFEIDSAGNEVSQKEFYQTPSNVVLQSGAAHQGFWKGHFSYGYYQNGGGYVGFINRTDSLGVKQWGGERPGVIVNSIFINKESSFIMATNGPGINITRLTKDSVVLWNLFLGGIGQPYRFMNGLYFSSPDTGIAYGTYYQETGPAGNQFWLAKIAGVGTAYDPVHPEDTVTVSAQERLFRPKDSPLLYPNPATETIRFHKLTQETKVSIYSTRGEKLLEEWIFPEQVLDVCTLPDGPYLYHLKMGERVFTGKFLKR